MKIPMDVKISKSHFFLLRIRNFLNEKFSQNRIKISIEKKAKRFFIFSKMKEKKTFGFDQIIVGFATEVREKKRIRREEKIIYWSVSVQTMAHLTSDLSNMHVHVVEARFGYAQCGCLTNKREITTTKYQKLSTKWKWVNRKSISIQKKKNLINFALSIFSEKMGNDVIRWFKRKLIETDKIFLSLKKWRENFFWEYRHQHHIYTLFLLIVPPYITLRLLRERLKNKCTQEFLFITKKKCFFFIHCVAWFCCKRARDDVYRWRERHQTTRESQSTNKVYEYNLIW